MNLKCTQRQNWVASGMWIRNIIFLILKRELLFYFDIVMKQPDDSQFLYDFTAEYAHL